MPKQKTVSQALKRKTRAKSKTSPADLGESKKKYHKAVKDGASFSAALNKIMKVHGDTPLTLFRAVERSGEKYTSDTIENWTKRRTTPRWVTSFVLLERIERRYELPAGYFKSKIFPESASRRALESVTAVQQQVLRWHLPADFDARTSSEQEEILNWIWQNVLAGSTEYGKYLRTVTQRRYSLRFPASCDPRSRKPLPDRYRLYAGGDDEPSAADGKMSRLVDAPKKLANEITEFVNYKRSTITPSGLRRYTGWSEYTAEVMVRHFGILFGALAASKRSSVNGLGVPLSKLTLAILIFPPLWDWFLGWRERRRGFLTRFERHLMQYMMSMTRRGTGWIRQKPRLGRKLQVIPGLITSNNIAKARSNWGRACDAAYDYFRDRSREITQVMRTHRDPFHPIMCVLKSDSPLSEYRKITDEIFRRMPEEMSSPLEVAETVRAYLMLRFGMHLGLRQRNLRELLLCHSGNQPTSTFQLETMLCGEIRWHAQDKGWEVFIPGRAFKNSKSSYFKRGPFRVILPDLDGLYRVINEYVEKHRPLLLGGFQDPRTFFVRTLKSDRKSGAYEMNTFYGAWRLAIQRYGIYNPYTGKGAVVGLLPHGPHNVRDVLATHVLKQTGSYEMAGFAVHDTPEIVRKHYCRFLPEEKTALAAKILNQVWQ